MTRSRISIVLAAAVAVLVSAGVTRLADGDAVTLRTYISGYPVRTIDVRADGMSVAETTRSHSVSPFLLSTTSVWVRRGNNLLWRQSGSARTMLHRCARYGGREADTVRVNVHYYRGWRRQVAVMPVTTGLCD